MLNLSVAVALSDDATREIVVLRAHPGVFEPMASHPAVSWLRQQTKHSDPVPLRHRPPIARLVEITSQAWILLFDPGTTPLPSSAARTGWLTNHHGHGQVALRQRLSLDPPHNCG